jgi:GGDEF domain-containing protein
MPVRRRRCGEAGPAALAERLRRSLASQAWRLRPVTVSIGLSDDDAPGEAADLIRAADVALKRPSVRAATWSA